MLLKYRQKGVNIYLGNPRIDYKSQSYDVVNNLNFTNDNIISGPYLNIFNAHAVNFMHEQGFDVISLSLELTKDEIASLIASYQQLYLVKPNVMVMVYGYYEAMISKHCLINKSLGFDKLGCNACHLKQYYLKDNSGKRYPLIDDGACNLKILNDSPVSLIDYLQELITIGVNNFLLDFSIESNIEGILKAYINAFNNREYELYLNKTSIGHFKEEVI